LALAVRPHGEQGQIVMGANGMVLLQQRIEDREPVEPAAGDLGQATLVVPGRRQRRARVR